MLNLSPKNEYLIVMFLERLVHIGFTHRHLLWRTEGRRIGISLLPTGRITHSATFLQVADFPRMTLEYPLK